MSALIARHSLQKALRVESEVVGLDLEDSKAAGAVDNLQKIIQQALGLGEIIRVMWPQMRDNLFRCRIRDLVGVRGIVERAFDVAERVFQDLERPITSAKNFGFQVEGADDWWIGHEEVKRLRSEFEAQWPKFDLRVTHAALANIKAGKVRPAEELLNEAKGLP